MYELRAFGEPRYCDALERFRCTEIFRDPDPDRSLKFIRLGCISKHTPLHHYEAGDHAYIFPQNKHAEVALQHLGLIEVADSVIDVHYITGSCLDEQVEAEGAPFPCPTTYRIALTRWLDINAPVSKEFVASIDPELFSEEEVILEVFSPRSNQEGDQMEEKCAVTPRDFAAQGLLHPAVTLVTLFEWFPFLSAATGAKQGHIPVPFDLVLQHVDKMRPRTYSIVSSPDVDDGEVHLVVSKVRRKQS